MKNWIRVALLGVLLTIGAGTSATAFGQNCSVSTLSGSYGFAASGLIPITGASGNSRWEPFALVGLVNFDGAGNVTVLGRAQAKGSLGNANYKGTYTINAGCVGAASFTDNQNQPTMRWEFVITNSGTQIETLALFPPVHGRPLFSTNFQQRKL